MIRKTLIFFALLITSANALAVEKEWRFQVFIDDKKIGYHEFVLRKVDNQLRLKSEANFEYRLMFVKLYGYQHENNEVWSGDCLTGLDSTTDVNGKPFRVSGALRGGRFVVNGTAGETELSSCAMSFAYWNPAFLKQERLINAQNGEILDVEVSEPELVQLEVRGIMQPAYRYLLGAGELQIELWYSENKEWLALETEARGGRRLRYELL